VRDGYGKLREAGGDVALIVPASPTQAADFRARLGLPFRCLADADGQAHRAYGLARGSLAAVAGPAIWRRAWRALWRYGGGRVTGDPYRLPGAFVIDTAGIVRLAHRSTTSADWPAVDELTAALDGLRR
jgi:peroxiredoxin